MTVNRYDVGDVVKLTASFVDDAGDPVDPTTVSLYIQDPSGNVATETYNPGNITRVSEGNYRYDLAIDEHGSWLWRWESTGTGQAGGESELVVSVQRVSA